MIDREHELSMPSFAKRTSRIFDNSVQPFDRMRLMDDKEFEDLTTAWLISKKPLQYRNVAQIGGSKDSGRDVVAYIKDRPKEFDIYQCKHYQVALTPSVYCVEFGKLCYYTFISKYNVPEKYYIVGSNGIGEDLRCLVEHPETISTFLIQNWNKYCAKKRQITSDGVLLTDELRQHISDFDFSIIADISPATLISEIVETKWFKYFFGGGLKKRPLVSKPACAVGSEERHLPYVSQLLSVYTHNFGVEFGAPEDLKGHFILKHFNNQRHCYFSAQSLARFTRDELYDDTVYEHIVSEVEYGIESTTRNEFESPLQRVDSILDKARTLPITSEYVHVDTLDKCGICHELVNEGDIYWHEN